MRPTRRDGRPVKGAAAEHQSRWAPADVKSVNRRSEIPASPTCPETLKQTPKKIGHAHCFSGNLADVRLDRGTYPHLMRDSDSRGTEASRGAARTSRFKAITYLPTHRVSGKAGRWERGSGVTGWNPVSVRAMPHVVNGESGNDARPDPSANAYQ